MTFRFKRHIVAIRGNLHPRRFAGALMLALAFGCAELPSRPAIGVPADQVSVPQPPPSDGFGPAYANPSTRLEAFELIWKTIGTKFYDATMNGVDWQAVHDRYRPQVEKAASDAELYRDWNAMARELKDSHTSVLTPRQSVERRGFRFTQVGVNVTPLDNELVVTELARGFPGVRAGVKTGMVMVAVDGVRLENPVAAGAPAPQPGESMSAVKIRTLDKLLQSHGDVPNGAIAFTFRRADNTDWDVSLAPETRDREPVVEFGMFPSGVGVVRFDRFVKESAAGLERAFSETDNASALIIDLRGNAGGLFDMYVWLLGRFIPEQKTVARMLRRGDDGKPLVTEVRPQPWKRVFTKPIAFVTDRRTGSAAELLVNTLMEQRGALVVGDNTCGCVVGVRQEYILPDNGGLRVSDTGFVTAGGNRMEGIPVAPTVRAGHTLVDLQAGRDRALMEAEHLLVSRAAAGNLAERKGGTSG